MLKKKGGGTSFLLTCRKIAKQIIKTVKTKCHNDWTKVNILSYNNGQKELKNATYDLVSKTINALIICELRKNNEPIPNFMAQDENAIWSTVNAFKGRENDYIVLINLFSFNNHQQQVNKPEYDRLQTTNVEYVALSRHRKYLDVFIFDYDGYYTKGENNFWAVSLAHNYQQLKKSNRFYFYDEHLKLVRRASDYQSKLLKYSQSDNQATPVKISDLINNWDGINQYLKQQNYLQLDGSESIDFNWNINHTHIVNFKDDIGTIIPFVANQLHQDIDKSVEYALSINGEVDKIAMVENNIEPLVIALGKIQKQLIINNKIFQQLVQDPQLDSKKFEQWLWNINDMEDANANIIKPMIEMYSKWTNQPKENIRKHIDNCKQHCLQQPLLKSISENYWWFLSSIVARVDYLDNYLLTEFKFINKEKEKYEAALYQILCYYVCVKLITEITSCPKIKKYYLKSENGFLNKTIKVPKDLLFLNLQTGDYWKKATKDIPLEVELMILKLIFNQNPSWWQTWRNYFKIINVEQNYKQTLLNNLYEDD